MLIIFIWNMKFEISAWPISGFMLQNPFYVYGEFFRYRKITKGKI